MDRSGLTLTCGERMAKQEITVARLDIDRKKGERIRGEIARREGEM